ncbi:MAG TPA: acetoacetate decarboxylase family protein, partial [Kofleriaceae bacterium]|nr:acetoacetate decarboxylase family protein [Kofleriaceae bacterium]
MSDPLFVRRGGELVLPSPIFHERCVLRCFWLRADRRRLARLCARDFSTPSGGAVQVTPLSGAVAVTLAEVGRAASGSPASSFAGFAHELDLAFWIPVRIRAPGGVDRTGWCLPYLFVDHPHAMATGRELYGFPKTIAQLTYPADPNEPGLYAADTWHVARRGSSGLAPGRLVTLSPRSPGSPGSPQPARRPSRAAGELASLALLRNRVPLVFLRQLRDVARPERAAFQEIVLAECDVTAIREVTPIPARYVLDLAPSASHPIALELGLREGGHAAVAAFTTDFDFTIHEGRTLWRPPAAAPRVKRPLSGQRRRKIAVLGGGIGALSAVWALTNDPSWRERLDLTVYQVGWRLGGKGASSRNPHRWGRIEEHGLHVWFGFYHHAFRMIRGVYDELGRPPGAPLATFDDAFLPHDRVAFHEPSGPWILDYPRNARTPGDAAGLDTPGALAAALERWLRGALELALLPPRRGERRGAADWAHGLARLVFAACAGAGLACDRGLAPLAPRSRLVSRMRALLRAALAASTRGSDARRRLWIAIDLAVTALFGLRADRLRERGLAAADGEDLRAWLRRHGASDEALDSAPLRVCYDMVFAYRDGDRARPDLAAGTGLALLGKLLFDHAGAFMWKMNGGMGEVVFAPLHQVLARRGVEFRFFHRAVSLGLAAGGARVSTIALEVQATPARGGYRPLVEVDGVPCWPHAPDLSQLVEGAALEGANLEATTPGTAPVQRTIELALGRDFDEVILGVPVGALPPMCGELVRAHPRWRELLAGMTTTATASLQAWLAPPTGALGWGGPRPERGPVMGGLPGTFDTWADMSHVVAHERWPDGATPGSAAYLCGPLAEPPADDRAAATARLARAIEEDPARAFGPLAAANGAVWERLI